MKHFGLIGERLSHSFSKSYFEHKFETLKIDAKYSNFECADLNQIKELLALKTCQGYNVTIPYKEAIIPLLDELDDVASKIGAVNTIKVLNTKLVGCNTDAFGFKQMIKPFFKSHHERAIILGTGGASKAVQYVLEELGASVIFISRSPKNENEFGYDEINDIMLDSCKIIVNTTPVGTFPNVNDELPFPYHFLTPKHLVIDLIYNPKETKLLQHAKQQGSWVLNGQTMLQQQAEKAWEIWNSNE